MNIAIFGISLMVLCNANNVSVKQSDMRDFALAMATGDKDVLQFRGEIETFKHFICQVKEQLRKVSSHLQKQNQEFMIKLTIQ